MVKARRKSSTATMEPTGMPLSGLRPVSPTAQLEAVQRMSRDLRAAAATLSADEARFLVDNYYAMQKSRIRADNQVRAMGESAEPHGVLTWLGDQHGLLERQVRGALARYADAQVVGRWTQSIVGIGPVLTAGLLAHIDIERAPTAGAIWRYAGLDPSVTWGKGEKRPWNGRLKTLCWKIGESFVKVQGRDGDVYGRIYAERKRLEIERNEAGELADQAAEQLRLKNIGKNTPTYAAYAQGRLSDGHIHSRAKRYAVKIFLSHLFQVMHETHHGTPAPLPYILATDAAHTHFMPPPNWPLKEG